MAADLTPERRAELRRQAAHPANPPGPCCGHAVLRGPHPAPCTGERPPVRRFNCREVLALLDLADEADALRARLGDAVLDMSADARRERDRVVAGYERLNKDLRVEVERLRREAARATIAEAAEQVALKENARLAAEVERLRAMLDEASGALREDDASARWALSSRIDDALDERSEG